MIRDFTNTKVMDEYEAIQKLITEGDFSQAEVTIKKAIVQGADTPSYYYLWGRLAERQGDLLFAKQNYQRAIVISTAIRTDYANLVAQRQPLATEHPFCLMIPYPAEYLSKPSLALAGLMLKENNPTGAVEVCQNLLKHEPYNLGAQPLLKQILRDYPELNNH